MPPSNLTQNQAGQALKAALKKGLIRDEDTLVIFYDLEFLGERLEYLLRCFPPGTLHCLAIKANPLFNMLLKIRDISSFIGIEAASIGEVTLALEAGFQPGRIVYDSPVKTRQEIAFAIKTGIHLNLDNLDEAERVNLLNPEASAATFGLRINPQVGVGTIAESSVAGQYSKFGVPLHDKQPEIENVFLTYPWLTGVHLHVGSQGCAIPMLAEGTGIIYDFVCQLNARRKAINFPPISIFDIGGGLPVSYHSASNAPDMQDYVNLIRKRAPGLLDNSGQMFRIFTEFGRWVFTNPGWTVSRVEYVKHDRGINTAMLHAGADLFVRECLNPGAWSHDYSVFDSAGNLRTGTDSTPWNLAGPLCFSGDIIAKNLSIPPISEGDYVVIHDTGGYTFSMWSRYNSRQTPRILGYSKENFEVLKERESLEELLRFWR
jgi:diaminopimelate decarboxylase